MLLISDDLKVVIYIISLGPLRESLSTTASEGTGSTVACCLFDSGLYMTSSLRTSDAGNGISRDIATCSGVHIALL